MMEMTEVERTLLAEQLDWYRLQRHDFLNHWQVVMGYIQLKQNDKALEYMREAWQGLAAEQEAGQIRQPMLAAILLGLIVQFHQNKAEVELTIPAEMHQENYWHELWREEYVPVFYGYTKECLRDFSLHMEKRKNIYVEIELSSVGLGFTCQVMLYAGQEDDPNGEAELLVKKIISLPNAGDD